VKFQRGAYELLPGIRARYALTVVGVEARDGSLTVTAYDRPAERRGDLIDGAVITARFSSSREGVLRVRLAHFKGLRPRRPGFDLRQDDDSYTPDVGGDEDSAWLQTGPLRVTVPLRGAFQYSFLGHGEPLTSSQPRGVALFTDSDENTYLREQLSLAVGETAYGLGERFGPFVKNGQSVDMWNEDGGTATEWAYKNVPFYLTSRGYGVLVDHPGAVSFEVASHRVDSVEFSVAGHSLEYLLFAGPTPKGVLDRYTSVAGRPPLLPEWSFGLWLSTSFLTNYDEGAILANLEGMAQSGIPVSVCHLDCFWMKELTWSSLAWDTRYFPDPVGMLERIHAHGAKVCLWVNPYIAEASPLFEEGASAGFLLKTPEGDVYQEDRWQPGLAFVDFTNPAATQWFQDHLRTLIRMGVDTFKTDFGERVPTDVRYHDGSDPERMHNHYSFLYNQAVFDLLREELGDGNAVVFARSATPGGQRFPVHWSGDNSSTYVSMAETLRGGLSLGLCGFGFWSHDISGFFGTATPDLYQRWVAFGMLSSHSRLHGSDTPRMPWLFGDDSVAALRSFAELKQRILPYLMHTAREAHEHGWPMLRAMILEFPDDPACRYLDRQYMLGSDLLVAPVFQATGEVTYYLPAGSWRHLLTGEEATGPGYRTDIVGALELPLWVRPDAQATWDCLGSGG